MSMNEADSRYHLIDPLLREKGYISRNQISMDRYYCWRRMPGTT